MIPRPLVFTREGHLRPPCSPSPTPLDQALAFAEALRGQPNAIPVAPDVRHWELFTRLCRDADARGNLIPDAWLAALAIESGAEFITTDRDYARCAGLRWRHRLDA
jgi:uncharacterized protein